MQYKLLAPPSVEIDRQTAELQRLLTFAKRVVCTFVTVAGQYKAQRARLTLIAVPDAIATPAERALQVMLGRADAVVVSADVAPRPEWTLTAILNPTSPTAPALDGTLLEGWDSACLTITYTRGRVMAILRCCAEDQERLQRLVLAGWTVVVKPNPMALITAGGAWTGTPSLLPVPGGVAPKPTARSSDDALPIAVEPPQPITAEVAAILSDDPQGPGLLLGVDMDGQGVRLAHRAMTIALESAPTTRASAVFALMRRAMSSGMGMVVAVDRSLLPSEALAAWEARMRLLDVQDVASSAAIAWRETPPAQITQALGSRSSLARLPAQPGELLTSVGLSDLCTPGVLGLLAAPGDDLRGVLAAGGIVVVPQDGDLASQVIARMLLASLTPPPPLGRPILFLADPALVAPDGLRQQLVTVVVGARADAVVRLVALEQGWDLRTPDGRSLAMLLPDLMAQPATGAGALVETIVRTIQPDVPLPAGMALPVHDGEPMTWWDGGSRNDDLDADDLETEEAVGSDLMQAETTEPLVSSTDDMGVWEEEGKTPDSGHADSGAEPSADSRAEPTAGDDPVALLPINTIGEEPQPASEGLAEPTALTTPAWDTDSGLGDWMALTISHDTLPPLTEGEDLDAALDALFEALMEADLSGPRIVLSMTQEDYVAARAVQQQLPPPASWLWAVVLAAEPAERIQALQTAMMGIAGSSDAAMWMPFLDTIKRAMPEMIPDVPISASEWAISSIGDDPGDAIRAEPIPPIQSPAAMGPGGWIGSSEDMLEQDNLITEPTTLLQAESPISALEWAILPSEGHQEPADGTIAEPTHAILSEPPISAPEWAILPIADDQHQADAAPTVTSMPYQPAVLVSPIEPIPPIPAHAPIFPLETSISPDSLSQVWDAAAIHHAWAQGASIPDLIRQVMAEMSLDHATTRTWVKAAIADPTNAAAPFPAESPIASSAATLGSGVPMADPDDQPTLSPAQVGAILGCSDGAVRKLIKDGKLVSVKDANGAHRIALNVVRRYQASRQEVVA